MRPSVVFLLHATGIESLLFANDGDYVVETISFEELGQSAAGIEVLQSSDSMQEVPQDGESLLSVKEDLKGLAVASAALERLGYYNSDVQAVLCTCQRELRAQELVEIKQTAMTHDFKLI